MRIFIGLAFLILAAACATAVGTDYMPADSKGFGYVDTKIEDNRYRITFAGDGATPLEVVEDFALLRAADIAVENGYDWFKIVTRDVKSQNKGGIGVGAGFGTGSYGRGGGVNVGVGGDLGTIGARQFFTSRIEVIFGRGDIPEEGEIYDAKSVQQNIRSRISPSEDF